MAARPDPVGWPVGLAMRPLTAGEREQERGLSVFKRWHGRRWPAGDHNDYGDCDRFCPCYRLLGIGHIEPGGEEQMPLAAVEAEDVINMEWAGDSSVARAYDAMMTDPWTCDDSPVRPLRASTAMPSSYVFPKAPPPQLDVPSVKQRMLRECEDLKEVFCRRLQHWAVPRHHVYVHYTNVVHVMVGKRFAGVDVESMMRVAQGYKCQGLDRVHIICPFPGIYLAVALTKTGLPCPPGTQPPDAD